MGLLRKKKSPLFGSGVVPDCKYCRNSERSGEIRICTLNLQMQETSKGSVCKKYLYNPLLREPRVAPRIDSASFTKEDFSL